MSIYCGEVGRHRSNSAEKLVYIFHIYSVIGSLQSHTALYLKHLGYNNTKPHCFEAVSIAQYFSNFVFPICNAVQHDQQLSDFSRPISRISLNRLYSIIPCLCKWMYEMCNTFSASWPCGPNSESWHRAIGPHWWCGALEKISILMRRGVSDIRGHITIGAPKVDEPILSLTQIKMS